MSMHTLATLVVAVASGAALVAFDASLPETPGTPAATPQETRMIQHPFGALIADFTQRLATHWSAEPVVALHELDARTLHDIGVDASEIGSIEAESRGVVATTRRRIVAGLAHA